MSSSSLTPEHVMTSYDDVCRAIDIGSIVFLGGGVDQNYGVVTAAIALEGCSGRRGGGGGGGRAVRLITLGDDELSWVCPLFEDETIMIQTLDGAVHIHRPIDHAGPDQ